MVPSPAVRRTVAFDIAVTPARPRHNFHPHARTNDTKKKHQVAFLQQWSKKQHGKTDQKQRIYKGPRNLYIFLRCDVIGT